MTELADALDLPRLPRRIECFDISNLQGTNPVASMVVFEDGRPAKKEYRRFTIKTVEGTNDFAMMQRGHPPPLPPRRRGRRGERRQVDRPSPTWSSSTAARASSTPPWRRSTRSAWTVTDLRPGQGERGALPARPAGLDHPAARLAGALPRPARARRGAPLRRHLPPPAPRRRSTFHSALDEIPGVGPKRKQALLKHFGSVKAIKAASNGTHRRRGITPRSPSRSRRHVGASAGGP